jgi:hypothetical protein
VDCTAAGGVRAGAFGLTRPWSALPDDVPVRPTAAAGRRPVDRALLRRSWPRCARAALCRRRLGPVGGHGGVCRARDGRRSDLWHRSVANVARLAAGYGASPITPEQAVEVVAALQ